MEHKSLIVYATSNTGKQKEIAAFFRYYGLQATPFRELSDLDPDPEETGSTLGDNAMLKARSYAEALAASPKLKGKKVFVLSDDTGLFIPALNNEPGIKVRRWAGYKMGDEELIEYALQKMAHLHGADRSATFRTVLCLVPVDTNGRVDGLVTFEGSLSGKIREQAADIRIEGFPFESLFDADYYQMLLGDMHLMDPAEKMHRRIFNHRERALEGAVTWIKSVM